MDIEENTTPIINIATEFNGALSEFAITPFSAEISTLLDVLVNDAGPDCPFKCEFNSAAQYIYIAKALLFGDITTSEQMLDTTDPQQLWQLVSQICGVDEDTWLAWRDDVYLDAMRKKCERYPEMREILIRTVGYMLVEVRDPENTCGRALMRLREEILHP